MKFENKEEAKAAKIAAKEEKKAASKELHAFEKDNKLEADGDHSNDPKHGKKWSKLKDALTKKEKKVADIQEYLDNAKGEKKARATIYEYPQIKDEASGKMRDMTAGEKKRFRAAARAKKAKVEKGDTGTSKKSKKSGSKNGSSKKEGKSGKKSEKSEKKAEAAPAED